MKNIIGSLLTRGIPDIAGTCISIICIIHCLLLPVVLTPYLLGSLIPPAYLPVLQSHAVHEAMFVLTIIFGTTSLYYSARQGKHLPVLCLAVGLVSVSLTELLAHELIVVRLPGTLCVAGGHLWAIRGCGKGCNA